MKYWKEMILLVIYFSFQLVAFTSVTLAIAFVMEYYDVDFVTIVATSYLLGVFGMKFIWNDLIKMDKSLYNRRSKRDNNGK